ncbi:hypothetical protein EsVE80_17710 [Enterococcus saigonensis]|uniref:Uncharacterized protein n=1 Tax=Enterococcus saigonensis TaxID=1805431 RepID=A0A679I9E3_9ENTE|nr:hypothetical protein EsVE80_17710 [Enterococcus saigonensis]
MLDVFYWLSIVVTVLFFLATVGLFTAALFIQSRVWKYFKRRNLRG